MKKSKFLQNSKDMLSRSFNPVKCKMSLKLASSRLKLLRNKKEVQVKQMKRELAQLLESGNDQTALIRVEHVVREEKMMAAYDLIEIYCELIVARMPIIESQKTCPIDLKEAITSVVFASLRCGDVPELLDVRKHIMAKYGKDFITAAIELRPECGVSRMLVEKLSAKAPDGQTKLKILSAIAEEHNVKWDPNSFGEKDSMVPNDLLNGPSTFAQSSNIHAEPSRSEAPHIQSPTIDNKIHSLPSNFSDQDPRSSLGIQNPASQTSGVSSKFKSEQPPAVGDEKEQNLASSQTSGVSSRFKSELRPPVGDEKEHVIHKDSNSFYHDKQRWNMEFKDATSAAQAAAESAELASMAARAAAELSSQGRIARQYTMESNKLDSHIVRHEGPEKTVTSRLAAENIPDDSANRSSGHIRLQNEKGDPAGQNNLKTAADRFNEDGHGNTKGFSQSGSLRSKTSIHDSLNGDVQDVDVYSRTSSLKEATEGEINMKKATERKMSSKKHSVKDEADTANGWQEKFENFQEERIRKQPSRISSGSHSRVSYDENIFSNSEPQNFEYEAGENPFAGSGEGRTDKDMSQSSHEVTAAVFDKSDSDNDEYGFDADSKYDEQGSIHFPSSSKTSPKHSPINRDAWSPRTSSIKLVENSTSSLFSTEKQLSPVGSSKLDNFVPVTFDDSDDPHFDSDEDLDKSGQDDTKGYGNLPAGQNLSPVRTSFKEKGYSGSNRKQLSLSSDDEVKSEEVFGENNQRTKYDADSRKMISLGRSANQPLPRPENFQSVRSSFKEKGSSVSNRKQLSLSSDDEVKPEEVFGENNQRAKFNADSRKRFSLGRSANQPTPSPENFQSVRSSFKEKGYSGSNRKQLSSSSDDEVKTEEVLRENNQRAKFHADSRKRFSLERPAANQPSPRPENFESVRSLFKEKGYSGSNRKQLSSSSDDEVKSQEMYRENNQRAKFDADSRRMFSLGKSSADSDSDETGNGLNFGKLSGGFRHKGNNPPPFLKSRLDDQVSTKKTAEKTSTIVLQSTASPTAESYRSSVVLDDKISTRGQYPHPDSDTDSSEEEASHPETSGYRSQSYTHGAGKEVKKKSSLGVSIFDSDNSDLDEDAPKQSVTRKSHLRSGISRRTKAPTSNSETNASPKIRHGSEVDSDPAIGRKPSTSYISKTPQESRSQTSKTDKRENSEQPTSAKAASKPMNSSFSRTHELSASEKAASASKSMNSSFSRTSEPSASEKAAPKPMNSSFSRTPELSTSEKAAPLTKQESKISQKSSDVERPSSPRPKREAPESCENEKTSKISSNKEDRPKKASHVHPKLPDYDTIAAKLQSLRQDRQ